MVSSGFIYKILSKVMNVLNTCVPIPKNFTIAIGKNKYTAKTFDRVMALFFWKHGMLESYETENIKNMISEDMVVLDIGANIGYYTLIFSDLVGNGGVVYAFEPDPDNYMTLTENVKANHCNNVVALSKAVAQKNGSVTLYRNEGNRGDHSIHDYTGDKKNTVIVDCVSLDSYFSQGTKVHFVKMDIQGAEPEAFEGMKRILKENTDIMLLTELMPANYADTGKGAQDFLKMLDHEYGFIVYYVDGTRKKLVRLNEDEIQKKCFGGKSINVVLKRN